MSDECIAEAAIVAEWRSLGADIRLDRNTALDPTDDAAPQWLTLGKGWCYLPLGLQRRVQDNQPAIVRYLRDEVIAEVRLELAG